MRLDIRVPVGVPIVVQLAATDVLHTLACHAEDTDWRTWSLYDLNTQVPSEHF